MEITDTSLVLVAIMPKKRDMEIARVLGWYRIPLKSAPKIIRADLIAFYQTTDFGKGHASCIEHYAEVTGVELTTRASLFRDEPDHPRAAEEYYKIQLGPIMTLPKPIPASRWKRFTFLYTTGDRLLSAQTINDLAVNSTEKAALWHALRERAASEAFGRAAEPEIDLPQELVFLLGNLSVQNLSFFSTEYSENETKE